MDLNNIWKSFLEKIKTQVSDITYDTWFSETKIDHISENIVTLIVPMHVHKKMLSENYNEMIEELFTEVSGSNFKFEYLTEDEVTDNITIKCFSII